MINFFDNKGISILGIIFLGVIIIFVLSYFHISIQTVVENPDTQENFGYVGGVSHNLWHDYLEKPLTYFWKEIVVNIFWRAFIENFERIRDGQPTDAEMSAPRFDY